MTAVYGGTFDPFHRGHEHVVRWLIDHLNPSQVLIIPNQVSPLSHLKGAPHASPAHRLAMAKIASETIDPNVLVSPLEVERLGPSFTVDTLETLAPLHSDLVLVLGSDSATLFSRWKSPNRILELANILIIHRGAFNIRDFAQANEIAATNSQELVHTSGHWIRAVEIDALDISATSLRTEIADYWTNPIADFKPQGIQTPVWNFIKVNRTYADSLHR